jgi:TonB family protein
MKTTKLSVTLSGFKSIIALIFIITLISVATSCRGKSDWEAGLTKILPPPIPPPTSNPPTMTGGDTIWSKTDEAPLFPGGNELLARYISKHRIYPEAAKIKGTTGQVVLKFCISSTGVVSDHEIVRGADPDLDTEALRVVKTLTRFEPARINGEPVASWYYMPITFALK